MKKAVMFLTFFLLLCLHATYITPKKLPDIVEKADHIIIGKVVKVDMINKDGKQITDPQSQTGPGLDNRIRLHVEVKKDGILKTAGSNIPNNLIIPLWEIWHYTLGQWKDSAEGKSFIFLLKGEKYERICPYYFRRNISDKKEVETLLKGSKTQNKKSQ